MELRAGYKLTAVSGVLPEDWDVQPLGKLASVSAGGTPNRGNADYWNGGIPWVTTSEIDFHTITHARQFISKQGLDNSAARLLPPGTLLMALYGQGKTRGKVGILGIEAATNQACAAISVNRGISSEFVFYFLSSQYEAIRKLSNTGNQENLNGSLVRSISIVLPKSEDEQHAIAEALSDVDALLDGLERLIAKKRDLKQATMQQLLTGRIRLPGFLGAWDVGCLREIAELHRQNIVPATQPNQPFLHFSLPAFDAGRQAVTEFGTSIGSNKFRVPSDAILVSKLNPRIHRVWAPPFVPHNAIASTEWLILTPRKGVHRQFLFMLCSSPSFSDEMMKSATGTTGSHQRISADTALAIAMRFPLDQEEQEAIATVLSDMDAEIEALEQRRDKTRLLKQGMMQELLTGRTRLV